VKQALAQIGVHDGPSFEAFLERTVRKLAPVLSDEFPTRERLLRGVERAIYTHTQNIAALVRRPDAMLLREYRNRVLQQTAAPAREVDLGRDGHIVFLSDEHHLSYGGKDIPPSEWFRIRQRRATPLELERVGLLNPRSFDQAVHRKMLELAKLDTSALSPAAVEEARARLKARVVEIAELEEIVVDHKKDFYLSLLEQVRDALGIQSIRFGEADAFGVPVVLSLEKVFKIPHGVLRFQRGNGAQTPVGVYELSLFGLDTKQALRAAIIDKLAQFSPDQIPLSAEVTP
jgi:hypothetical protein